MKKLLIGISAGALALGTAAFAADMQMPKGHEMTRAEAKTRAEEAFAKLDINHDGKLDAADRAAQAGKMFDKLDANHDGSISRDEFLAAHKGMGMGGPGMGGPGWGHDGPPPPGGDSHEGMEGRHHGGRMGEGMKGGMMRPGQMGMLMAIMHEADPARSGTVTKDAFVAGALKLFDKADANHDGTVTAAERRAARQAMMGEMRKAMMGRMGKMGHEGMMDHDMPPPPPPAN